MDYLGRIEEMQKEGIPMNTKAILTPEEQENYLYNVLRQQANTASEKEVETELYGLLLQYYQRYLRQHGEVGVVSYNNPHRIDGLLTISTTETSHRILIEAKTHSSITATGIWAPLAQAFQYTHLLSHLGELLPGIILITTEREWHAVQVDSLAPLLSRDDLPWESVPSARSPEIEGALQELNPAIISHALYSSLDLNEALGGITSLLMGSRYRATKQHGINLSQQGAILDVDPTTHLYHAPSKQWWGYDESKEIWTPMEQRDLTLKLREQARESGAPERGVTPLINTTLQQAMSTCSVEKFPSTKGAVNTPRGSWNMATRIMEAPLPLHGHRHCTGPLNEPLNIGVAKLAARGLNVAAGMSNGEILLVVAENEELVNTARDSLGRVLGSYAVEGDSRYLTSQRRWNPSRGDAPILLLRSSSSDLVSGDKFSSTLGEFIASRFTDGSVVIVLVSEGEYKAMGLNHLVSADVFATALDGLDGEQAIMLEWLGRENTLEPYEGNDLLLAWFNECVKEDKKSFILTKDALDNYNNWALSRGNTKLSMRTFTANLVPHITFRNANAIYEPRKFIRKDEDYTQSVYRVDETTPPREAARIDSMFLHLAFQ